MFDMGLIEMAMIFVVALLVIGPEKLPQVARTLGKYVAKARRFVAGVRSDIERELHADELRQILKDQSEQIDDLKEVLDDTRKQLHNTATDVVEEIQSGVDDAAEMVKIESGKTGES